jgi:ferritin
MQQGPLQAQPPMISKEHDMLNKSLEKAFNEQIKYELYSAYFYLSATAYFESLSLDGFSHWMRMQAQEEVAHGIKLFDFILDRNGRVTLQAIEQPPATFTSPLDACRQALQHEQKVTALINDLYELAVKEKDFSAQVLLHWFISEQVEEEKTITKLVDELELAGDNPSALLLLNKEYTQRTA